MNDINFKIINGRPATRFLGKIAGEAEWMDLGFNRDADEALECFAMLSDAPEGSEIVVVEAF